MDARKFKEQVWSYYRTFGRQFPWRSKPNEYNVFISEVMLQQTQAGSRTITKFNDFVKRFPDFQSLASASLKDILGLWQGLGYNRRALYLKKAAEVICTQFKGELPSSVEELDALPGIGPATARSISAFAFNTPVVFIETNIRSVYLHHFFSGKENVSDAELMPLIEETLDRENSREWYSALMDYGSMLKKQEGNVSRRSKHYAKQSTFEGSTRELRGKILRSLTENPIPYDDLVLVINDARADAIITKLKEEGLIKDYGTKMGIA